MQLGVFTDVITGGGSNVAIDFMHFEHHVYGRGSLWNVKFGDFQQVINQVDEVGEVIVAYDNLVLFKGAPPPVHSGLKREMYIFETRCSNNSTQGFTIERPPDT